MIFSVEGTYWPSSGELSDFDMRRHVLSIMCLLKSKSYSSPDNGQYVPSQDNIIGLPR
jgi:hypothetical protein